MLLITPVIVFAKILSGFVMVASVIFIAPVTAIIFSDQLRTDATSLPHVVISAACNLNTYAIYLLVITFLLLCLEIWLKRSMVQSAGQTVRFMERWKKILFLEFETSPYVYLVSTLSRGVLVLFFVGQLSYLLNYCRLAAPGVYSNLNN